MRNAIRIAECAFDFRIAVCSACMPFNFAKPSACGGAAFIDAREDRDK